MYCSQEEPVAEKTLHAHVGMMSAVLVMRHASRTALLKPSANGLFPTRGAPYVYMVMWECRARAGPLHGKCEKEKARVTPCDRGE